MSRVDGILERETIERIAREACEDESAEVTSHRLEAYSKHAVGFGGSHNALEVAVRLDSNPEPVKLELFVKSIPRTTGYQSEFIKRRRIFDREARFFNELMPQLLEAAEIESWAPRCYLANDELVVLEDLRARGYGVLKTKRGFEGPSLRSPLRAMARLHAASVLAEHRLGKSLAELYPEATSETIYTRDFLKYSSARLESLIEKVAEKAGRRADDYRKGIHQAIDLINSGKDGNESAVVCHGDAWPSNVMMTTTTEDDEEEPKCLLIDYQQVRYAPRMFDVAELICASTSKDVRDREERSALEAYWCELCEMLRKSAPEVARPSLEELLKEYEEAKIAGLLNAILCYPSILLGEEVYEEHEDDLAVFKKFIFRENNDCVIEHMDKDEHYGRRITEVVLEFLDRCETLD